MRDSHIHIDNCYLTILYHIVRTMTPAFTETLMSLVQEARGSSRLRRSALALQPKQKKEQLLTNSTPSVANL